MSGLEGRRAAGRESPDSAQTRPSNTALAWGSTRRLSIGPHGEAAAGRDSQEDPEARSHASLVCFIRDSSSDESSDESCCTTAPTPCPLETVSSAGHLVGPDSSDPAQRPGTARRSSTTRSGGVLATYSAGGPHNRESSSGHRHHPACHGEGKKRQTFLRRLSPWICMPNTKKKWITFTLFWVVVGGGVVFGLLYGFTKFVDTVIEPTTESAQEKLNQWQFASVLCACIVVLPLVFIPPLPFVWVIAMLYSMWIAFAIVQIAVTVSMAVGYILARRYLHKPACRFLNRYRHVKAVLMSVDAAGPFRVALLIRLGPLPFTIENYVMAVPQSLTFMPYIMGSILGQLPGNVLGVYFGKNIKGLGAMLRGEKTSPGQIAYNVCGLLLSIVIVGAGFWYAKRAIRKIEREQEEAKAAAELAAAQHNLMYGEDPPEGGGDEARPGDKPNGEAEAGRTADGCTAGTGAGTAGCDEMAVLDAKVAAKHLAVWAGEAEGLGVQGIPAPGGGGGLAACDGLPRVRRSSSLKQQLLQEQQEAAAMAAAGKSGGSGSGDRGLGPRSMSSGRRRQGQQLSSPCTARVAPAPAAAGSEAAGWEELRDRPSPARPSGGRASYITASGGGSLLQSCSSGSLAAAAAGRAPPPPLPPLPLGQPLPLPLGQSPLGQSPSRISRDSGGDRSMLTSPPLAYKRVAQLRDQATCGGGAAAAAAATTAAAATSGGGSSGVSAPASPMYAASAEGSHSARVASVISLGMVGLEEDAFRAALDEDSDPWVGQCDALSSPRDSAAEMVLHANTVGCTGGVAVGVGAGGGAGQGLVGSVVGSGSCHRSLSALMVRKPSVQAMAGLAGAGGGEEGGGSGGGSGTATPGWRRGGAAVEYEHIVVPPSPQRPVRPASASVGGLAAPRSNLGMSCGGVLPPPVAAVPVREAAVCYSGNDLPLVEGPLELDRVLEEEQAVAASVAARAVGVSADGDLPNTPARISLIGVPPAAAAAGVAPSTSGNGRGAGAGRG